MEIIYHINMVQIFLQGLWSIKQGILRFEAPRGEITIITHSHYHQVFLSPLYSVSFPSADCIQNSDPRKIPAPVRGAAQIRFLPFLSPLSKYPFRINLFYSSSCCSVFFHSFFWIQQHWPLRPFPSVISENVRQWNTDCELRGNRGKWPVFKSVQFTTSEIQGFPGVAAWSWYTSSLLNDLREIR